MLAKTLIYRYLINVVFKHEVLIIVCCCELDVLQTTAHVFSCSTAANRTQLKCNGGAKCRLNLPMQRQNFKFDKCINTTAMALAWPCRWDCPLAGRDVEHTISVARSTTDPRTQKLLLVIDDERTTSTCQNHYIATNIRQTTDSRHRRVRSLASCSRPELAASTAGPSWLAVEPPRCCWN